MDSFCLQTVTVCAYFSSDSDKITFSAETDIFYDLYEFKNFFMMDWFLFKMSVDGLE